MGDQFPYEGRDKWGHGEPGERAACAGPTPGCENGHCRDWSDRELPCCGCGYNGDLSTACPPEVEDDGTPWTHASGRTARAVGEDDRG